jgi:signal recognition particle receptor subunit beta
MLPHQEAIAVVVVSYSGKEINAKLVYYGMGLCGKTTNLEAIYEKVPDTSRGKMVSMKTQSDRTLFFDLLPIDLGDVMGFKTRFLLYTVPGQVFYNATRKLVLKGADAIVFVVDSERGKMDENKESLSNLRANLAEYKVNLNDLPWVMQYNKRDLPDVYSIEELQRELNTDGVPYTEAVASQNQGVMETFETVSQMLIERVTRDLKRQPGGSREPAKAVASRGPTVPPPPSTRKETAPTLPAAQTTPATAPAAASSSSAVTDKPAKESSWGGDDFPSYGRDLDLPAETESKPAEAPAKPMSKSATRFAPRRKLSENTETPKATPVAAASIGGTTATEGENLVVPVKLARGQKLREIVLKIVIEDEEA